jgi:hypothetical protein
MTRFLQRLRIGPRSPSPILFGLLAMVLTSLVLFVRSQVEGSLLGIEMPRIDLDQREWIILLGVYGGVTGWLISSIVAIRNSIRQHSVNILLQSRLSQTYVERASLVHARYFHPMGIRCLTEDEMQSNAPEAQLPALRYVLSYLEFIAVGIRYGDLDEKLMRRTLRGLVCNLYEASAVLTGGGQGARSSDACRPGATLGTLDNLAWLYDYWFDERLQQPRVFVAMPSSTLAGERETTSVEIVRQHGPQTAGAGHA